MDVELKTQKIGSKWHGFIEGRPDIDETALSETAVRRKVESARTQLGDCGGATRLFGGRTCELVKGHKAPPGKRLQHQSGEIVWTELLPEDGPEALEPEPMR